MSKRQPSVPKKRSSEALFVRLPTPAFDKLDRAADALGVRKKDLIAGLVSKYVDPDSRRGLNELSTVAAHRITVENGPAEATVGTYSFHPYEAPEVMNAEQAGQFLQLSEAVVTELAEAGKLPGRKLGKAWRFSRAALVAWLSTPEKR
jgi:excisionase family DNA binding protein